MYRFVAGATNRIASRNAGVLLCSSSAVAPSVSLGRYAPRQTVPSFTPAAVGLTMQRREQHNRGGDHNVDGIDSSTLVDAEYSLHGELNSLLHGDDGAHMEADAMTASAGQANTSTDAGSLVQLEKLDRPPARFDLITNSLVYRWQTTARLARKVSGPMREWATELKYRTGVHMELEPTYPERLVLREEDGGYGLADDVDMTVYLFGSERGIFNCRQLMESALQLDPAYVRLGVFRRIPDGGTGDVEWLMLRRINRELRPPDIPPISLKLPGKWTLLYEQYREAAIRTLWEETGITVAGSDVFPTARLHQTLPQYYWRVPVYYFIAEVPHDVEVRGPQVLPGSYVRQWDSHLLRQSPDVIDRVWAQVANPETGCAWMKTAMIDELQLPLRGEDYMSIRYTPPPYSNLEEVLGFKTPDEKRASESEGIGNVQEGGADTPSSSTPSN